MPIDYSDYAPDWKVISERIRFVRAGNRCEGSPTYPECRAENGKPHPATGSKVVLTVAHLDHDIGNNDDDNLRAWCQRCHLTYDAPHHVRNAALTRRRKQIEAGQMEMPLTDLTTALDSASIEWLERRQRVYEKMIAKGFDIDQTAHRHAGVILDYIATLEADNERLRDEIIVLTNMKNAAMAEVDITDKRIAELEAENERLKEQIELMENR